jgi:hypothetical protein
VNINENIFSALLFQGEIMVLVGFSADSFPPEEAKIFALTHFSTIFWVTAGQSGRAMTGHTIPSWLSP